MISRRVLFLSVLPMTLHVAGCTNVRPLYGGGTHSAAAQGLSQVSVAEQKNRAGQLVRNEILSGRSVVDGAPFVLNMNVTESGKATAGTSARVQYRMTATYSLVDTANGKVVDEGKSYSVVSFDTVSEPLADLQAENAARQRAARELGQDIKIRLAARFTG
jgi:LPS-assembly lipoprotein